MMGDGLSSSCRGGCAAEVLVFASHWMMYSTRSLYGKQVLYLESGSMVFLAIERVQCCVYKVCTVQQHAYKCRQSESESESQCSTNTNTDTNTDTDTDADTDTRYQLYNPPPPPCEWPGWPDGLRDLIFWAYY